MATTPEAYSQLYKRDLPGNPEAEQAVLAAIILDKDVLVEAVARLKAEDFGRAAHRNIFAAIVELSEKRIPVDQISLADRLEARGELQSVGGLNYLVELANNSLAIYNWEHHLEIVRRYSLMRALIGVSKEIEAAHARREWDRLRQLSRDLENEIRFNTGDKAIEKAARDQLGLVYPDEIVFETD